MCVCTDAKIEKKIVSRPPEIAEIKRGPRDYLLLDDGRRLTASLRRYSCVLILLYMHILLYMRPHTTICVLILIYVSSYYYMCVLILYMCPQTTIDVSSYYYICVLILPYMCPATSSLHSGPRTVLKLLYICPHTTI